MTTTKTACHSFDRLFAAATGGSASPELDSHLEACPRCRRRTERMRRTVEALGAGTGDTPAPDRPALLGRYFVVGELPTGGPGRAYRGLHPTLIFDVELHWAEEPADEAARQRLAREAPLLAGLIQPGLARALDADLHDGRIFVATERVNRDLPLHRPATARAAAAVVARLARQVAVAHGRGLVHGAIGPDCLVADPEGQPRLTGMGLALVRPGPTKMPADDVIGLAEVLRSLVPEEMPWCLAAVCNKATAGDYASATDFAADLERFVHRPRLLRRVIATVAAGLALASLAWVILGW